MFLSLDYWLCVSNKPNHPKIGISIIINITTPLFVLRDIELTSDCIIKQFVFNGKSGYI